MQTLPRPVRLSTQKCWFFFIKLNISLLFIQLYLVNVINLLDIRVIYEVHNPTTLQPRFHPEQISINRAVTRGHAMLTLHRFDENSCETSEGRVSVLVRRVIIL